MYLVMGNKCFFRVVVGWSVSSILRTNTKHTRTQTCYYDDQSIALHFLWFVFLVCCMLMFGSLVVGYFLGARSPTRSFLACSTIGKLLFRAPLCFSIVPVR